MTARFEDALVHAARLHAGQRRKGSDVPYVCHVLAVASLVLEEGGTEDEAIAALLHDAVEDTAETVEGIAARFGPAVAAVVAECTGPTDEGPWRQRKQAIVDQVATASPSARRVELADKVHNARSIVADHARVGPAVWDRFGGGREDVLWYYRALADEFARITEGFLVDELGRLAGELERLAGGATG
jgi:(p)ppGpp synthase/HD superfamily hydrolase